MGLVFLANKLNRSFAENGVAKVDESPSYIKRKITSKVVSRKQNVKPLTLSNRKYLYSLPEFSGYVKNE